MAILELDGIDTLQPTLFDIDTPLRRAERYAGMFLAGYGVENTRRNYAHILRDYFEFLVTLEPTIDPVNDIRRHIVELYLRHLEAEGKMASTVGRHISTIAMWYRWLVGEEYLLRDPTLNVRRPKVPRESNTPYLTSRELTLFLEVAQDERPDAYSLCCLLAYNGLRISEACNADVTDLGELNGHRTLHIVGKGGKPKTIGLPHQTVDALKRSVGTRGEGPLILTRKGSRMQREAAGRIIRNCTDRAGIKKRISPHGLRHSAITALLVATDGNVTAAQDFARHSDVGTTMRYDRRRRDNPARSGSYVLAYHLAGGE